jgi:hypothetical protein
LVNKGVEKGGKKKSTNHKSGFRKVSCRGEQPAEKNGKVAGRGDFEYELISEESDRCYSSRSDDGLVAGILDLEGRLSNNSLPKNKNSEENDGQVLVESSHTLRRVSNGDGFRPRKENNLVLRYVIRRIIRSLRFLRRFVFRWKVGGGMSAILVCFMIIRILRRS